MKLPVTPARDVSFVSCTWIFGGIIASFTGGCVRELTGYTLTLEARPQLDASSLHDAANGDAGDAASRGGAGVLLPAWDVGVDAALFDAGVENTGLQDAWTKLDSGQEQSEASAASVELPVTDTAAASSAMPGNPVSDAGSLKYDASVEAPTSAELWPFDVASPLGGDDAGVSSVALFKTPGLVVDGSSTDWSSDGWLWIATPELSVGSPQSDVDLSAVLSVRWDNERLYLVVVVRDERHVNDASGYDIWGGDSIQVAFDVGLGRSPYDWEYGFANTDGGKVAHRWREGDADLTNDIEFAVVRHRAMTVYEVAFDARHLGVNAFPTNALRFSVAVNDNDEQERSAALELVQGIVGAKSADQFATTVWGP